MKPHDFTDEEAWDFEADLLAALDLIADGIERRFAGGGDDAPAPDAMTRLREARAAAHAPDE